MTYYTLAIRYEDGRWGPEYGSYLQSDVIDEGKAYIYSEGTRRKDLRIVKSAEDQVSIETAINNLNRRTDI